MERGARLSLRYVGRMEGELFAILASALLLRRLGRCVLFGLWGREGWMVLLLLFGFWDYLLEQEEVVSAKTTSEMEEL